jgi:hypothetical protein
VLACALVFAGPAPHARAFRQDGFIANKNSRIYHKPTCASARRLSEENRAALPGIQAVRAGGYKPCGICHPDEVEAAPAQAPTRSPLQGLRQAPRDARVVLVAVALPPPQEAPAEKLKFSKDIAPILNGNCMGCHNPRKKSGEFDLSTFQNMMKGSQSGEVIVPGKPEESLLVELVETRKMPRNANNRPLADSSIEKIRQWVKQGALLDEGISPTASLDKIAPTAEQARREELAKMSPEQRDQQLAQTALQRWKKASAETTPKMTTGNNFLLFGNLPEDRAVSALKILEDARARLVGLLGDENAKALAGPEKISVYVFNDLNAYAEFVRGVERREPEDSVEAHGNLTVQAPYLAVVDPLAGGPEPEQPKQNSKKRDEDFTGPDHTLSAKLLEVLASSSVQAAGAPPMWLSSGLGAYFASLVEARSPYLMRLRIQTAEQGKLGWTTKATEALGDEGSAEFLRGFGLSLCEWMASSSSLRQKFPMFVQGMLGGTAKLDDTIKGCFGATREQLLNAWGGWVSSRYGPLLRRR